MAAEISLPAASPLAAPRRRRRLDKAVLALGIFVGAVLLFLYLPVVVLIIFSFNDNIVTTLPLRGFTFGWYEKLFANSDMMAAI
ncbi:MAG: hypothetical protein JNN33_10630, partial [Rhodospirillaceae bacterium]|nr:hypothetical protein [Rhodospirillaceae bacterium]